MNRLRKSYEPVENELRELQRGEVLYVTVSQHTRACSNTRRVYSLFGHLEHVRAPAAWCSERTVKTKKIPNQFKPTEM